MARKQTTMKSGHKPQSSKPTTKGTKQSSARRQKEHDRVQQACDLFTKLIDSYLQRDQSPQIDTLLWISEFACQQLRHCLEVKKIPGLTWDSPILSFNWPIRWDWEAWKAGAAHSHVCLEPFNAQNTRTPSLMKKTVFRNMVDLTTVLSLQLLTHFVGLEKRGSRYRPILSQEATDELKKVKSARKRQALFESFFNPFSMGAGSVYIDEKDIKPNKRIPQSLAVQLAQLHDQIDLPPLEAHVNQDGLNMKFLFCFQIHPFVVDVPKRQAYFPLTVGFIIVPEAENEDLALDSFDDPRLNPANWSRSDREKLWKAFFEAFKELQKQYDAKPDSEMREAMIEITAKVKVPLRCGEDSPASRVMEGLLKSFAQHGEIIQANIRPVIEEKLLVQERHPQMRSLLTKVETETDSDLKGKALEDLVCVLFESVSGFKVGQRARTATEEIDLHVLNESGSSRWQKEGPLIIIECKNWSSKCGKNELVQLRAKLKNRRGRCRLGFLVSWQGFANTIREELLRSSEEDLVVGLIDGSQIREAVKTGDFESVLHQSWKAAVLS